jgi:hypothetical protein
MAFPAGPTGGVAAPVSIKRRHLIDHRTKFSAQQQGSGNDVYKPNTNSMVWLR